ncbi:unnamed protein product [Clavelina lepadiformis]|uniref:Uncharacterized protein n=1 Tax=Clavelina lepadiformis TaxID=159417 RepID=A0ABP0FG61_CLALP
MFISFAQIQLCVLGLNLDDRGIQKDEQISSVKVVQSLPHDTGMTYYSRFDKFYGNSNKTQRTSQNKRKLKLVKPEPIKLLRRFYLGTNNV